MFQEPEQMLNGEPPQIHPAQVLRGNSFWTRPEEPERAFVTRCPVFLQELDTDDGTHNFGKPLEMQFVPDTHPHLLLAKVKLFAGIWRAGNVCQLKVGPMLAWRTLTAFRLWHRFLAEFLVVLQPHQSIGVLQICNSP